MRSFLALVALAVLIHGGLVHLWWSTAGAEHAAVRLDEAFLKGPKRVRILFAGDSHTRNAIDPESLGNVQNIAVGGEHFLKTKYRLQWLLTQGDVQVDAVVLPLEASSFTSWKADNFEPEGVWGRYVDFVEVGRRRGDVVAYLGRAVKGRVFPYVGEADTWFQYLVGAAAFREEAGLGTFALASPQERAHQARDAAERHFKGNRVDDPSLVWAFRSLIRWLNAKDIRVVLMAYPVSRPYQMAAAGYGGRAVAREGVLPGLLEREAVEFLDYEDVMFGDDRFFLDADHLNVLGARQLSRAIRPRLVEMGLLDKSSTTPTPSGS